MRHEASALCARCRELGLTNSVLARPAPAARGGHADASRWSVTVSGLSAVASRVAMVGLRPDGHATCRSSRSSISISSGLERGAGAWRRGLPRACT